MALHMFERQISCYDKSWWRSALRVLFMPGLILILVQVLLLVFITNQLARVSIGILSFLLVLYFLCWCGLACVFSFGWVDEQEPYDFDGPGQLCVWLFSGGLVGIGTHANIERQWSKVKASGGR
jgi:hypothetical protein